VSAAEPTPAWPSLPDGYGADAQTGRPGAAVPWETVVSWLRDARNYWLCTARRDGRVHVKPVWALWMDGAVVFSTSRESVSGRHLRADPRVTMHLEGAHVAVVEGTVEWLAEWPPGFVEGYEQKYDWRIDPADALTPPLALRPRVVLSWDEADLAGTMTRWTF
jgi:Pyridoxamine 5'-phosphate oxidase